MISLLRKVFKKYTLQKHIILVFLSILVWFFLIISIYGFKRNSDSVTALSKTYIDRIQTNLHKRINERFFEIQTFADLSTALYNSEKEVSKDNIALISTMTEIVRNYNLTHITTGTKSGNYLMVKKVSNNDTFYSDPNKKLPPGSAFAIQYIDLSEKSKINKWYYQDNSKKILETENIQNLEPDYRLRPWYKLVEESRTVCWSEIYKFHATNTLGISVSAPVYNDSNGEFIGVFAFNLTLEKISQCLKESKLNDDSKLFILDTKGEVIASDCYKERGQKKITLVNDSQDELLHKAYRFAEDYPDNNSFTINHNGMNYVINFSIFPSVISIDSNGKEISSNEFNKDWRLMIAIPESMLIGNIKNIQIEVLYISIIFLILSAVLISIVAKQITNPIIVLTEIANRIKSFNLTSVDKFKSQIYELNSLNDAIDSMRISMIAFTKFIPKVLVGKLLKNNQDIKIGGKIQKATFFFTDIEGFTNICETYSPDKLSIHLSQYFEELTKIIFQYNGVIDKYIGDAIMAFWGAPVKDKDQVLNACKAAIAINKKLIQLNQQWAAEGKPILNTRIGIHVGEAIIGNMGSSDRINYTAIGDSVNLAARLEGINKRYHTNIIVSHSVIEEISKNCLVRPLDIVAVKGKNLGVEIYELVGILNGDPFLLPSKQQRTFCEKFTISYRLYKEQRWDEAISSFENIQKDFADDYSVQLYITRCKELKESPPPADWDGTIILQEK